MGILEAIILGIVQGLTEFLPVSSSGHIELVKAIFGTEVKDSMTMTVVLHFATALSTCVIFRKDIIEIIKGLFQFKNNEEFRFSAKIVISMIPAAIIGLKYDDFIETFFEGKIMIVGFMLLVTGAFLTMIFTALSFNIALSNENKIKGFGYAVLLWLFLAVIYDGLFLMSLIIFKEYPLDSFSLAATMFNPIDLSRTLILLKLDISALLGYTGAVFKQFFGTNQGLIISILMLILWTVLPIWRLISKSEQKDF